MSTHYRERKEAGAYDPDPEKAEKAGVKFDKEWAKQVEAQQEAAVEEQGTANP